MKRLLAIATLTVALGFLVIACESSTFGPEPGDRAMAEPHAQTDVRTAAKGPSTLQVTATDAHTFELNRSTIPSGWTTIRMHNKSHAPHFVFVAKLPEDEGQYADEVSFEAYKSQITKPFQGVMDLILDGEDLMAAFGAVAADFPDWFADVQYMGGVGYTAEGVSAETTLELEPGTYVIECYVKNADNVFHTTLGMLEKIEVTEQESRAREPRADLNITLSTTGGIQAEEIVRLGRHTIAVHFEDQPAFGYEHLLGHDVHLARLNGTDIEKLAAQDWMNWSVEDGLTSPLLRQVEFLGGVQTMDVEDGPVTAYFTVELSPGEYAWVSEVPAANEMWETFTVSPPRTAQPGHNH